MYAIIEDRGNQYNVREGDTIEIQLQDVPEDTDKLVFENVLMVGEGENARIGQPLVPDAKVSASIKNEIKGDKVTIFKMKRRKGYRRKQGHRQRYLQIQIDKIEAPGIEA
ncbi:MAG: 50S ribosomal protein L21 [Phycisphaerae bacterium]|nr:50S ribosomal protein L21 [Phycisphaerae bacterium]